jgi:hypothetical protein
MNVVDVDVVEDVDDVEVVVVEEVDELVDVAGVFSAINLNCFIPKRHTVKPRLLRPGIKKIFLFQPGRV